MLYINLNNQGQWGTMDDEREWMIIVAIGGWRKIVPILWVKKKKKKKKFFLFHEGVHHVLSWLACSPTKYRDKEK